MCGIHLYNFCTKGIIMVKKKKSNNEDQLIVNAFINIIKDTPRQQSESVIEELNRGKRHR